MKKLLLTFFLSLFGLMLMAIPVNKETARQKAVEFLTKKNGNVAAARGMRPVSLNLQDNVACDELYAFNVGQRDGFVIISADDCTGDLVLGYADQGELNADNMPENLRAWLQGYDDQIAWMKQHGISQQAASRGEGTATVRTPIAPLLTTLWNQNSPYNDRCPMVLADPNDGSTITRAATGCLATAAAQVMNWHQQRYGQQTGRWTTTTQPIPSYQQLAPYPIVTSWTDAKHYTVTDSVEGKEPTTIDWRKLSDVYPASDEANAEVAKLMEYAGAGLKMKYGPASEAFFSDFAPMLINYFGYNVSASFVQRNSYDYDEWVTLMYDQLEHVGPLFYGGQSTGGGHAFVLDGYDEEDYFHVNWGWGGQSDGYFKLSVLYSKKQGIGGSTSSDGFNFAQNTTINVNPDNSADDPDINARLTVINVWTDITTIEKLPTENKFNFKDQIHAQFYNLLAEETEFETALGIYKGPKLLKVIEMGDNMRYNPSAGFNDRRYRFEIDAIYPDGTYRLVPMSRKKGNDTWYDMHNSRNRYFLMTINGNKLTLDAMRYVDFKATLAVGEQPTVGKPLTITATVTNNGAFYSGDLLLLHKIAQSYKTLVSQEVGIANGQTAQYDFTFTPQQEGEMNIMLGTDNDSITAITISVAPSTTTKGKLSFKDADDVTLNEGNFDKGIYGNAVSGTIKITNTGTDDHTSGITIILCHVVDMATHLGEEAGIVTSDIVIPKNGTKEIPYEFDGLITGEHYFLYVAMSGTMEKINSSAIFAVNPGIDFYAADGTAFYAAPQSAIEMPEKAVALDLTQVSGVTTVMPNSNLNALYYVGNEVPEGLTGKNVVKEGTLERLTFSEGYDFFAPMGFTVTAAPAYSRIFSPTGWSTIILPFDVTSVEIDGKTIDCTHLDSETDKTMRLMTFAEENEGIVRFEPAEDFEANTPYLITFPGQTNAKIATFYGAENAYVEATTKRNFSGNLYKFTGTLSRQAASAERYMLNNDGTAFTIQPNVRVSSFRAFFKPLKEQHAQTLTIVTDETSGISETLSTKSPASTALYNLQGLRIAQPKRGIYIKNGKKVVVGRY